MRIQNGYTVYQKWRDATWPQHGPKMYQLVVVFVFKTTWPPVYSGCTAAPHHGHLGIQKHLCWPMGYSGKDVWGATPEDKH